MKANSAKYSNGKTSKLYQAEVYLKGNHIEIIYKDDFGMSKIVDWDIQNINTDKFGISFGFQITYGDFPFQTLYVDETFYNEFQKQYPNKKLKDKTTSLIQKKTWKTILVSFLLVATFGALMYFFVVPEAADHLANQIPISLEEDLGESIYNQNMIPFDIDSSKTELANKYFKALNVNSDYNVQITVVNSKQINAFAMPGGHIVVFSELLDQMKNHEEFAGVLAHEYGHIYYRHSLRSMARNLSYYIVLSLIIGDVSGLSGVMIDNAENIRSLQYSRTLESEADNFAYELLQKKHVNPEGIVWLFNSLIKAKEKQEIEIDIPEFLSSHPDTKHRIENIEKRITEDQVKRYHNNEELETIWGMIKSL